MKSDPKVHRPARARRQNHPRHRRGGIHRQQLHPVPARTAIPNIRIVNLDKLTYAGNLDNLSDVACDIRHEFIRGDIRDRELVGGIVEHVQGVFHFAAETHVDRSILDAGEFVMTDVHGTYVLLEAVRRAPARRVLPPRLHGRSLRQPRRGLLQGDRPDQSLLALLGQQGRRGPAGLRLPRDLRHAGHDRPAEQQLRPLSSIPRSSSPSSSPTPWRAGPCRSTARGRTSATGCSSRTTAGRSTSSPGAAPPGRPTTSGRTTSARTSTSPAGSSSTSASRAT